MKKTSLLLSLVALLFCTHLFAQTENQFKPNPKFPNLFKTIPSISTNDPSWVKALYSKTPNLREIETLYNTYYSSNPFVKNIHTQNYKFFKRALRVNGQVDNTGKITLKKFNPIFSFQANTNTNKLISSSPANWVNIGPKETYNVINPQPVAKQANVFSFSQSLTDPDVLIAGTQPGDVFISLDQGDNWEIVTDQIGLPYSSIRVVEIDPNSDQIMYFTSYGHLYKSTDQGQTWNNIVSFGGTIRSISIKEGSSNDITIVGAFGIQRSTDGGSNWTSINTKNSWDAVRKTDDPNTIFTVQLNTTNNVIEFAKSTDNGLTYTAYTNGWKTPTGASMVHAEGARIGVTNADADVVYVLLLQSDTDRFLDYDFTGVYKSTDAGENWTLPYGNGGSPYNTTDNWCLSTIGVNPATSASDYSQGFYNAAIAVSDTDPDTFIVGLINTFKSSDGGQSYQNIGGYASCANCYDSGETRHADVQDIDINGNDIWVITDGGIDKYSTDFQTNTPKMNNLVATEFFGFDQAWNEDIIAGGRYHNGNVVMRGSYANNSGREVGGGEQATGYFDRVGNTVRFSDSDDIYVPENVDDALVAAPFNLEKYPNQDPEPRYGGNIAINPKNGSEMILGRFNQIWKSTDKGQSFDLKYTYNGTFSTQFSGRFTNMTYASNDTNIIYALQNLSYPAHKIYKSIDGGDTWNEVNTTTATSTFGLAPIEIQVAADNDNEVYLASSSSLQISFRKSMDGGATWTDLPSIPGNTLLSFQIQDGTDGGLYAANANGVFYINDSMSAWQPFSDGLPASKQPRSIKPFYKEGKLRIGTGNRGVWESPMYEASKPIARPIVDTENYVCLKDTVRFDDYSILKHAGATWNWNFPGATYVSSTSVRNPKVLYGAIGNYDVSLTITDATGATDTKTISEMVKINENLCELSLIANKALSSSSDLNNRLLVSEEDLDYLDPSNNLTLSAWVKPTNQYNTVRGIITVFSDVQFGNNVFNFRNGIYLSGSNEVIYFDGTGAFSTGLYIDPNEWNYVAAVWNGSSLTIYVNDESITRNASGNAATRKNYVVADINGNGATRFTGLMDELKIYKRSLSRDEIYASRHIIKDISTDPDLIAYYQFNSQSPTGKHYNVVDITKSIVPGQVNGGSSSFTLDTSDAPIGAGVTQKINVTANGIADFDQADLKIDFASGAVPDGDVVVTRLDIAPVNKPTSEIIADKYWIINNYGNNDIFETINSMEFYGVPSNGISAANISLYKRGSNDFQGGNWGNNTPNIATSIDTPNQVITFGNTNIDSFSQFYLGSNQTLSTNEFNTKPTAIKPFPNPSEGTVSFTGTFKQLNFKLMDISGKVLFNDDIKNNSDQLKLENISSGIYIYKIETENKIRFGKLAVQ